MATLCRSILFPTQTSKNDQLGMTSLHQEEHWLFQRSVRLFTTKYSDPSVYRGGKGEPGLILFSISGLEDKGRLEVLESLLHSVWEGWMAAVWGVRGEWNSQISAWSLDGQKHRCCIFRGVWSGALCRIPVENEKMHQTHQTSPCLFCCSENWWNNPASTNQPEISQNISS